MGWGTTYVLVCNPDRDAPVWVEKEGITARRWGPRRLRPSADCATRVVLWRRLASGDGRG